MKILMKTALTLAIGSLTVMSTSAYAGKHSNKHYRQHHNADYAKVIDVYPITEQVKYSEPVRHCYDKNVWHESSKRHHRGHKNEIVGALIGAAVGNRLGKRVGGSNGRDITTAAGAVIGGLIGHDNSRRYHDNRKQSSGYYKTVKHCDTTHEVSYEEKIVAYKVKYKYKGQIYKTRTKYHPGDQIKVRVNVAPY